VSVLPTRALLTPAEELAVRSFVHRLQAALGDVVRQIILYGSKARGDSEPASDIDILIVVEVEDWPLFDEISLIASRVSLEHNVLLSARAVGEARWEQMRRERFTLYQNVLRDGISLSSDLDA